MTSNYDHKLETEEQNLASKQTTNWDFGVMDHAYVEILRMLISKGRDQI